MKPLEKAPGPNATAVEALQWAMQGNKPTLPPKPRLFVHRADRNSIPPETYQTHTIIFHGVDPIEEARQQGHDEALAPFRAATNVFLWLTVVAMATATLWFLVSLFIN